jgi:hypothetical protein
MNFGLSQNSLFGTDQSGTTESIPPDIDWDGDAELKKEDCRRFSLLAASIDLSNAGSVDVV